MTAAELASRHPGLTLAEADLILMTAVMGYGAATAELLDGMVAEYLTARDNPPPRARTADRRRPGDAPDERTRRARVVKGWAFRDLTEEENAAIRAYLDGGPVPAGYEHLDEVVR